MSKAEELIERVLARVDKAEADGSFYLRVNTWLTAGDGRDFCAQAPDDLRRLSRMLKVALEKLGTIKDIGECEDTSFEGFDPTDEANEALAEIERIAGEK